MEMIRLGDVGTALVATIVERDVVVNISASTSRKIYLRTPAGDVIEKTASLYTDGSDGNLSYVVESGLLPIHNKDLIGAWSYEAKCTIGAWTGTSDSAQFIVGDVLRRN